MKESILDTLHCTLALIGGDWITVMLIKSFSRTVYACPHCDKEIIPKTDHCPHYSVRLRWSLAVCRDNKTAERVCAVSVLVIVLLIIGTGIYIASTSPCLILPWFNLSLLCTTVFGFTCLVWPHSWHFYHYQLPVSATSINFLIFVTFSL